MTERYVLSLARRLIETEPEPIGFPLVSDRVTESR